MKSDLELQRILRELKGLPTLPHIYQAVSQIAADPNASAAKMAQVIQQDQSLTAKVLGLVNSPYYGLSGKVTSIAHAVAMLGFNTLQKVVLSASVVEVFRGGHLERFDLAQFWRHSLAVGTCSRILAKRSGLADPDAFFVGGLLHDIGKLVACEFMAEGFARALETASQGRPLHEAEEEALGFSHDRVGRLLLERWRLPEVLSFAVGAHHRPGSHLERLREASVIHVADIVCIGEGLGSGGNVRVPPLDHPAWDVLGLQPMEIESVIVRTERETEQAFSLFQPRKT